MGIDISQFLDTFYEESFEGLDIMETALLGMDTGAVDDETINTIFRAAHSIKGGSGTFGLMAVSDFTHVLETLLDEMRDGQRAVTPEAVELMLSSVDVLRDMLTALRESEELDKERIDEVHAALELMLKGEASGSDNGTASSRETESEETSVAGLGWVIDFQPMIHLFKTGNDPVRMFRELDELGELEVSINLENIPPFEDLAAEDCCVAWHLIYTGEASIDAIKEVFDWVTDDCDLTIEPLQGSDNTPVAAEAVIETEVTPQVATPAAVEENPVAATPKKPAKKPASTETSSIRVGIDKVDALINMVGELVITQSMLNQLGEEFTMDKLQRLQEGLAELEQHTRELQENVMRIRMLPISSAFNRFPRLVHDLSKKLGKKIALKLSGEQTELDKTVMEKISDPLVHLVRNSLDHGIETPDIRLAQGKSETGTLHLNAFHHGGHIVIEINDDGAGLNTDRIKAKAVEKGLIKEGEAIAPEKINELIFRPGFSTADVVSDVSGRGVGMDVVLRNIRDLGGSIEVKSEEGVGSTFTVRLPLTLAILDGQLMRVGNETYVVPLISITESLQIKAGGVKSIAGEAELYKVRDDYVPIVRLHEIFGVSPDTEALVGGLLIIAEGDGQPVGLFIDELMGQQQVVIKSLESNYKPVEGVSGATILGDGTVALIMDIPGLVGLAKKRFNQNKNRQTIAA